MATQGISGVGLAMATGGALLAYAGFTGKNPIAALKDITSGNPTGVHATSANLTTSSSATYASTGTGSSTSSLVGAAETYAGDHYSQLKRHQSGYSDCSSFVSKAYNKIGIAPPTPDTTLGYLASPRWTKITRASAQAGDLAVNSGHMAIFTDNTNGIGMQNSKRNVQAAPMSDLMYGTGSYVVLRYKSSAPTSAAV